MSTKQNNTSINTSNFIPSVLIIAFLMVGFLPNLNAVDKIAPQWLYLSALNIISALYIFYNKNYFLIPIIKTVKSKISFFYIAFFIWMSLSFFYAINQVEALVNIPRHSNTLFMFLNIGIFIYKIKEKRSLIAWLISIILFWEVYSVISEALLMIELKGYIDPNILKGVTANRNITAFSIVLKIPFVLYLIQNIKKPILIFVVSTLLFFSFLDLSILASRASFVAIFIIMIGQLFFTVHSFFGIKLKKEGYILKNLQKIAFVLIPLLLSILINQAYFSYKGADAIDRVSTISINTNDDSISKRLRYYEDVLTHMLSNPIFGTGIGNWKFESIKYDRLQIDGYIVPYHAHSDFIQLGAELGFIGFFLYIAIFITAIYFCFYVVFRSQLSYDEKIFMWFLLIAIGAYLVDANLNFPIARPQELAPWAISIALINYYYVKARESDNKLINKNNKRYELLKWIMPISILLISVPGTYMNFLTYKSQIKQMLILSDFNTDQYNIPLDQIETHIPSFPNVTVTTIPMDAIKARYYFNYQKYDKALEYALKSKFANPYLHYGDIIASRVYKIKGQAQKAKESAGKAFFGMPNNSLHIGEYLNIIVSQKDDESLEKAYPLLTGRNQIMGWKSYLVTKSALTQAGDPIFIKRAEKAQKLFPYDDQFRKLVKTAKIGMTRINQAFTISQQAQIKYTEKSYTEAANLYDRSIELDPFEYSYYENAALCYYSINDIDNALNRINVVVDKMNPLNGKCEYIKGLIFLKFGLQDDACELFETSISSGFIASQSVLDQYCNK